MYASFSGPLCQPEPVHKAVDNLRETQKRIMLRVTFQGLADV